MTELPIEIELEDCQIEWFKHHKDDRRLELYPDSQADKVVVASMKNCIELLESEWVHPDDAEEHKKLREACLLIIKHFATEEK